MDIFFIGGIINTIVNTAMAIQQLLVDSICRVAVTLILIIYKSWVFSPMIVLEELFESLAIGIVLIRYVVVYFWNML